MPVSQSGGCVSVSGCQLALLGVVPDFATHRVAAN
jgi:hypothetical protein